MGIGVNARLWCSYIPIVGDAVQYPNYIINYAEETAACGGPLSDWN